MAAIACPLQARAAAKTTRKACLLNSECHIERGRKESNFLDVAVDTAQADIWIGATKENKIKTRNLNRSRWVVDWIGPKSRVPGPVKNRFR